MTNHPNDDMTLLDLVEKHAGDDFVRQLLSWALHKVMDAEVGELTGAGKGEHAPERETSRNGYRPRDWDTRVGTIPLNIPKLREGSYLPSFLEPRRISERAFAATIQEAYVNGVSTRSVDRLVRAMGASGVAKESAILAARPFRNSLDRLDHDGNRADGAKVAGRSIGLDRIRESRVVEPTPRRPKRIGRERFVVPIMFWKPERGRSEIRADGRNAGTPRH